MSILIKSAPILISLLLSSAAVAEMKDFTIKIKGHVFSPAELEVPAGEKFKLIVVNEDPTPEEFESYDLNRERIINGGATLNLFIGPLDAGRYEYFGEFNPKTAQGVLIAK